MKKLFLITFVILMLFSTVSINVFAVSTPSVWAVEEVNNAKKDGIITNATTKDYQKGITREEFCELVVKLYEKLTNQSAKPGKDIFNDTDNQEILKAYNLGIVNGVSNNRFAPHNNITRQEICVMLVRCIDVAIDSADINKFNNNRFTDKNIISDWAIDYVNYAYDNGIMRGIGDNRIDPLGYTSCEQAILLSYRIYQSADKIDVSMWDNSGKVYKDYENTYNSNYSYCIEAPKKNDIRIKKKYNVEKNKLYIASAYFKTKSVVNTQEGNYGAGISYGDWNLSSTLFGNNDWKKVNMLVASGDKTEVEVSFNLGYWGNTCTGKVYISDMKLTEIVPQENASWKFLFVILKNNDITYKDKNGNEKREVNTMSNKEIDIITKMSKQFKNDLQHDSYGLVDPSVEVVVVEKPILEMTSESGNGLWLEPNQAYDLIKDSIDIDLYDHITVFANLNTIKTEYFGLGGTMFSQNTGYSFINTQSKEYCMMIFDNNQFWSPACPTHEFLHFMESWSRKLSDEIPISLHDAEKYGYKNINDWRAWYMDFINKRVQIGNGEVAGISKLVWSLPPSSIR